MTYGWYFPATQWMTFSGSFRTPIGAYLAYRKLKRDFKGCHSFKFVMKRPVNGRRFSRVWWMFATEPQKGTVAKFKAVARKEQV